MCIISIWTMCTQLSYISQKVVSSITGWKHSLQWLAGCIAVEGSRMGDRRNRSLRRESRAPDNVQVSRGSAWAAWMALSHLGGQTSRRRTNGREETLASSLEWKSPLYQFTGRMGFFLISNQPWRDSTLSSEKLPVVISTKVLAWERKKLKKDYHKAHFPSMATSFVSGSFMMAKVFCNYPGFVFPLKHKEFVCWSWIT